MLKYLISKMIVLKVVPYLTFDYANVGKRIKQYRISIGKTQEELAEMAGISKNYLSDIETGKSAGRLDKYYNIAQALGVTVDMLIKNTDCIYVKNIIKKSVVY